MLLSSMETAGLKRQVRFLGIELEIRGSVLRPRKETELLGRVARRLLDDTAQASICIDMCCGSGNLALALARHAPDLQVIACDLTAGAVQNARYNVLQLGFQDQVAVVQGDMFKPLAGLEGKIDLIISNPPYISTSRLLSGDRAHLLINEPREAFDGGPYGISLHSRLITEGAAFLKSGGWLAFEFGLGQDRQVAALLKRARAFEEPQWHLNEDGDKRVVCARKI
ncbi:peptide chain release factor N(5)-glutamine methyltransferase [Hyphomicrobium sp. 1Nfss2.1]